MNASFVYPYVYLISLDLPHTLHRCSKMTLQ